MVAHSSIIRDLLDLVEQDWLPEENKKQIQTLLIELIENACNEELYKSNPKDTIKVKIKFFIIDYI